MTHVAARFTRARAWLHVSVLGVSLLTTLPAVGANIAGVELPPTVTIEDHPNPLVLNGAGVRKVLFMSVYVGALYLPEAVHSREEAHAQEVKHMRMHLLRDVPEKRIRGAWDKGIEGNLTEDERTSLAQPIAQFSALFSSLSKGDNVTIDLLSDYVRVERNAALLGTIEHIGLQRAVLDTWLGEKPADDALKRALLGATP